MRTNRNMESPWRRLPWTLPTALVIWAAALWGLAYFMQRPASRQTAPPPIEAQLIEIPDPPPVETPSRVVEAPVPPEAPSAPSEPPPAAPPPKPALAVKPKPPPAPPRAPRARPKPGVQKAGAPPSDAPEVLSTSSAEPGAGEVASGAVEAPVEAKSSRNAAGSGDEKGLSRGNLSANSPARAMVQPVPLIPEELREAAFNSAALVRFHIAVDGGVEVELVKPTQNPRLNRILLDTLKRWRFSPALRNGQPVASTEEILVRIEVK